MESRFLTPDWYSRHCRASDEEDVGTPDTASALEKPPITAHSPTSIYRTPSMRPGELPALTNRRMNGRPDVFHSAILKRLYCLPGIVLRTVVGHDDFEVGARLAEHRPHGALNKLAAVVRRNDDAEQRHAGKLPSRRSQTRPELPCGSQDARRSSSHAERSRASSCSPTANTDRRGSRRTARETC